MKLNKWIHLVVIFSCIFTLFGCQGKKKVGTDDPVNEANAAYYRNDAQASGIGQEANFGEQQQAGMNEKRLAKRVYYFDFDSNVVHDEDKAAIDTNADYLVAHPNIKVMLEGHTDPRGSREYNIGLGERRAKAVARILTLKGVNPTQIRIVSYGAEKLAVPGHAEADFQQDRRVVLVYLQRA